MAEAHAWQGSFEVFCSFRGTRFRIDVVQGARTELLQAACEAFPYLIAAEEGTSVTVAKERLAQQQWTLEFAPDVPEDVRVKVREVVRTCSRAT